MEHYYRRPNPEHERRIEEECEEREEARRRLDERTERIVEHGSLEPYDPGARAQARRELGLPPESIDSTPWSGELHWDPVEGPALTAEELADRMLERAWLEYYDAGGPRPGPQPAGPAPDESPADPRPDAGERPPLADAA